MGEGKTRVILPMLILELADGTRLVREWGWTAWAGRLAAAHCTSGVALILHPRLQVRLSLLRPLLEEAYSYLQRAICASTLGRKLFLLPFNRDVVVTEHTVAAMRSALRMCNQARCCVEDRRSLHAHLHNNSQCLGLPCWHRWAACF